MPDKVPQKPKGLDSGFALAVTKYMSRAQTWVYRRTGGRIGAQHRIGAGFKKPVPTLLLDHVGRTSGKAYTTPLLYLVDGADLVVVASSGGMAKDPQWYRNLLAHPDTTVQVRAERRAVRARTASPEERAALWPRLVDLYADYESYQSWTDRVIPVVVLSPR